MDSISIVRVGNFYFINGFFLGLVCSKTINSEGVLKFDPAEEDTPAWGAVGGLIELVQFYNFYEKKPSKKILLGIEKRLILCYLLRKHYRISPQMSRQLDEIDDFANKIYTNLEKKD